MEVFPNLSDEEHILPEKEEDDAPKIVDSLVVEKIMLIRTIPSPNEDEPPIEQFYVKYKNLYVLIVSKFYYIVSDRICTAIGNHKSNWKKAIDEWCRRSNDSSNVASMQLQYSTRLVVWIINVHNVVRKHLGLWTRHMYTCGYFSNTTKMNHSIRIIFK